MKFTIVMDRCTGRNHVLFNRSALSFFESEIDADVRMLEQTYKENDEEFYNDVHLDVLASIYNWRDAYSNLLAGNTHFVVNHTYEVILGHSDSHSHNH